MCVLKIPLQIIEFVNRARRHCLWRKTEDKDEKCYSLAAWDMVCQPKNKGGLGIMDLKLLNQGLLLKFLRKFYNKHDVPWVMLVWDKYYNNGIPHAKKPCGSFWWRDVSSLSDIYGGVTRCSVNVGDTVLLWKDCWVGDIILQEQYPHLFSFSRQENCSVMQYTENESRADHYFLPLFEQATNELAELHDAIHTRTETFPCQTNGLIFGGSMTTRCINSTNIFSEMWCPILACLLYGRLNV
jgi:hypothetical protein